MHLLMNYYDFKDLYLGVCHHNNISTFYKDIYVYMYIGTYIWKGPCRTREGPKIPIGRQGR
jgi:hypothetical protein